MQIAIIKLADNYMEHYDWFYKCDDDTFPLMENLRAYLLSPEVKAVQAKGNGAFVGRRMNNTRALAGPTVEKAEITLYNGGGSGYLFDRVGLLKVSARVRAKDPRCLPTKRSHSDDLLLGNCATVAGVPIVDTRDSRGGERFHVFGMSQLLIL
jgi:glycoprotein-N-acetylgalactosamine 3-beta-galactosyltransferase